MANTKPSRRLSDEQIQELPTEFRSLTVAARKMGDTFTAVVANLRVHNAEYRRQRRVRS